MTVATTQAVEGKIDPLTLEVFWSRLIAVVDEQAASLIRTAFSPSVAEAGDISACAFDPRGYLIAQAVTGTPGHINSMARCIRHFLDAYPAETLAPGDVLLDCMAEFGMESILPLADEVITRSERAMREAIAAVPDGTYRYSLTMDGYDRPVTLSVAVTVRADEMLVDYAGTSPESDYG